MKKQTPIMWSEVHGHELYVFWRGRVIYKRWIDKKSKKSKKGMKQQPSVLFNHQWPNVEIQ